MSGSHTQRTLRRLEKNGWLAGVVEKWIPSPKHPGGGVRRDYLGIIDVIAVSPNGTLAVQSCAYSGVSDHVKKILASSTYEMVLAAGWGLEVWGWHKVGRFWQARIVAIEAP